MSLNQNELQLMDELNEEWVQMWKDAVKRKKK